MRYSAYGLSIESALEFPELPVGSTDVPIDVSIEFGVVPDKLQDPVSEGVLYQSAPDQFLLHLPKIASYLVEPDRIVVDPRDGIGDADVRVFLLGSTMGALLHQRGLLVLHAAAFATHHGTVLLAGPSGIGKSTLLGELLRRGYSMVVDDVCALNHALPDAPHVLAGYPRTRIWADSAAALSIDTDPLRRTRSGLEKFERQVHDHFEPEHQPLRALYVLESHNAPDFAVERLGPVEAFEAVVHNTYRRVFLNGFGMRPEHFRIASAAAAVAPVTVLRRPSGTFDLTGLADLVERDLEAVSEVA